MTININGITINNTTLSTSSGPGPEGPNLLAVPSDLSNPAWSKFNSSVELTGTTSPTGTTDVYKVIESAGLSAHGVYQFFAGATGLSYKYSAYAKALERTQLVINLEGDTAFFNLDTGTIGAVGASITSPSITSVGNGWYLCSAIKTMTGGAYYVEFDIGVANTYVYNGDGTSGIYLWDAKVSLI